MESGGKDGEVFRRNDEPARERLLCTNDHKRITEVAGTGMKSLKALGYSLNPLKNGIVLGEAY